MATGNGERRDGSWRTRLTQPEDRAPGGFRSLVPAVHRGSTTLFQRVADLRDTWDPRDRPYTYGLYGTPTALELAARLAELEGATATLLTPGGQAALALVYVACLDAGDHVLVPESVYGPSRQLADEVLSRLGVDVSYYPPTIGSGIRRHLRPATKLVWCESPGSLTFEVQDVPGIAEAAHESGALVAVDNTWSAGVLFSAFAHGADISIQALTKYVGGHSDLLLGSVSTASPELFTRLGATHGLLGYAVSPDDCYLAVRGLQTLAVRLDYVERSAREIAAWLAARPEVERVLHPAVPSCPGHDLWCRDFSGSSGVFGVVFRKGFGAEAVTRFVDRLALFKIGYSWGGVTSLAIPAAGEVQRADYPYDHRLVRLSIGLEPTGELIGDLEAALASMEPARP